MALSERTRNVMYRYFVASGIDEEVIGEVLSYFPARDTEEPVTKNDLRTESATLRLEVDTIIRSECDKVRTELKSDIAGLRTELKSDIAGLRTELKSDIAGLRTALKSDIADLHTESKSDIADLRGEIGELRSDMNQLVYWVIGTGLAFTGLLSGLIVVVH